MTTHGDATRDTYAGNADFWVKIIREGLDPYRTRLTDAAVLTAVGDCTGLRILDAGCGEGYLSRMLAERGADVVGIDTSDSLIAAAKSHPDAEPLSVEHFTASLEELPIEDSSFDAVVCNHVLSDVVNPDVALTELCRVLRPSGRLVAMMLHPCFYTAHAERDASGNVPVASYFTERKISQPFVVAGLESPDEVHMNFRSLEFYTKAFISAGFVIVGLDEPHPPVDQLVDDAWWRDNFVKPIFLLVSARRDM